MRLSRTARSRPRQAPARFDLQALEPRVLMSLVPYGADYRDNSEFMLGTVNVNVVLLESNGQVDANAETWNSTMIANVKREVTAGLQWWEDTLAARSSTHSVDFQIDFTYADTPVATRYEPIRRPYSDQTLWIDDFLTAVNSNTSNTTFTDMRQWNHAQRQAKATNWGFTVFVVNSLNDTDGKFSDGYSAYAYLGGPFMVLTYDNGGWNIDRMAEVMAHETGHIFYALDEYPGSNTYTDRSGYYSIQNLNAADGNPNTATRVTSLMAEGNSLVNAFNSHTSSPTSLQMIGWRDSDSDGIFDVLDVPLTLTGSGAFDAGAGGYRFMGSSSVGTIANQNPYGARHAITLNTVDQLQYRLNGGSWLAAASYGTYSASINQLIPVSGTGNQTLDLRTIDLDTGVTSNLWSTSFLAAAPAKGFTVTPLTSLTTTEAGGSARFSVVLNAQPSADVTISVASSDTTEGRVSASTLTFTAANWNQAQTVTVTGVDDAIVDGNVSYSAILGPAVSADSGYHNLNPADLTLSNTDNDVAVVANPAGIIVNAASGLTTTEAGGAAYFTVVLSSKPTGTVTIPLGTSDLSEGRSGVSSLKFTTTNWNVPQTVKARGADDKLRDGDIAYRILLKPASSTDPRYNKLDAADVTLVNLDNEVAGVQTSKKSPARTSEPSAGITLQTALTQQRQSRGTVSLSAVWSRDLRGSDAPTLLKNLRLREIG